MLAFTAALQEIFSEKLCPGRNFKNMFKIFSNFVLKYFLKIFWEKLCPGRNLQDQINPLCLCSFRIDLSSFTFSSSSVFSSTSTVFWLYHFLFNFQCHLHFVLDNQNVSYHFAVPSLRSIQATCTCALLSPFNVTFTFFLVIITSFSSNIKFTQASVPMCSSKPLSLSLSFAMSLSLFIIIIYHNILQCLPWDQLKSPCPCALLSPFHSHFHFHLLFITSNFTFTFSCSAYLEISSSPRAHVPSLVATLLLGLTLAQTHINNRLVHL